MQISNMERASLQQKPQHTRTGWRWMYRTIVFYMLLTIVITPANQPTAAHAAATCFPGEVYGFIGGKYRALGGPTGPTGCATSDEFDVPGGRARNFREGTIVWKRGTSVAYAVYGAIFATWNAAGREHSQWGLPVSDELPASDGIRRFSQFEAGGLIWDPQGPMLSFTPGYTLIVNWYRIDNTRSRHEDTNYVYVGVAQDGHTLDSRQQPMGDQNNGTYNSGLWAWADLTDLSKPITFSYVITNNGHGNADDIKKGLDAGIAVGTTIAGVFPPIGTIIGGVVSALWSIGGPLLFANCDGVDADAAITGDYHMFADWTAGQQTHTEERYHPGYDSAHGCGSNSKYTVSWTITRWAP